MMVYGHKNFMQTFPSNLVEMKIWLEHSMVISFPFWNGRTIFMGIINILGYEEYERK